MNRWFNPSHPQTLQIAVILGYFSAVFGLLGTIGGGLSPLLLLFIGVGAGAFGSANNRRWGYYLLAISSVLLAIMWVAFFARSLGGPIVDSLKFLNQTVFPTALAVAAVHVQSRQYQKVWFE